MDYIKNYEIIKQNVLQLIENSQFKYSISLIEVEEILPTNEIKKYFTIEGRVSKKLISKLINGWLNLLDKLDDQIFEVVSKYSSPKIATELYHEYWLVSVGVAKNDKFTSLKVNRLEGGEEFITVKKNQTLVIDVWASWCKYCQVPMEHNIELMKNRDITDKNIKIIGVSCDENLQALNSHLETKKWKSIPQYSYPNIRKNLDIITIPCVIIINKDSIIKHVGSPNDMKFEESIINISKGGEAIIDHYDDIQDNVWLIKLEDSKKKQIVKEINNKLYEERCGIAKLLLSITYLYEGLMEKNKKCVPLLIGKVSKQEMECVKRFEKLLLSEYNLRNVVNKCHVELLPKF